MYDQRLNKLRERCLNRAHLTEGASGEDLEGFKKEGLNLTTSHIRGYIENWSGRCSFWCRTTLRSNWKMSTTRRYLKLKTKIEKKNWKKKPGGTIIPAKCRDLAQSLVGDNQRLIKCSKHSSRKFSIDYSCPYQCVIHPAINLLSSSQTFKKQTIVQSLRHSRDKLWATLNPPLEVL